MQKINYNSKDWNPIQGYANISIFKAKKSEL